MNFLDQTELDIKDELKKIDFDKIEKYTHSVYDI